MMTSVGQSGPPLGPRGVAEQSVILQYGALRIRPLLSAQSVRHATPVGPSRCYASGSSHRRFSQHGG
ncbi:hypothetical protein NDU88_007786 [Pleurodeles waltl]|uniref:Uncharacterized protein n=1 Tax=Pleurodeles waltl TaxID=8319 RepID=A0AAV7NU22_PLEWA|nr:hypothetical protein NDU88_007786 [Pleurodeles waltl]